MSKNSLGNKILYHIKEDVKLNFHGIVQNMCIFSRYETISILVIFIFIHKTEHLIYKSTNLKTLDRKTCRY